MIENLSMSEDERALISAKLTSLEYAAPMNWSTLKEILTVTRAPVRNSVREDIDTGGPWGHGDQAEEQKVPEPESEFAEAGSTAPRASAMNPTWEDIEAVDFGDYLERGKEIFESAPTLMPGDQVHLLGVAVRFVDASRSPYKGAEVGIGKAKTSGGPLFTDSLSACAPVIAIAENAGGDKKAVLCHATQDCSVQFVVEHANVLRTEGYDIRALFSGGRTKGNIKHHRIVAACVKRYAQQIGAPYHVLKLEARSTLAVEVDPVDGTVVVSPSG